MSGGALEHVYFNVEEAAGEIKLRTSKGIYKKNPLYAQFVEHLWLTATALHAVEWVLSGDSGEGAADDAMRRVLGLKEGEHV